MLELQDGAGKESVSPWIDLCGDLGLFEERQPDLLGPTQTHDHYSGNLYFSNQRVRVSRLDQSIFCSYGFTSNR